MQTVTLAWQIEGQRQTYTLTGGRRCVIGRMNQGCDIILNSSTISRQHAAIEQVGETFYLWNLSQTNAIHVNERAHLAHRQSMPLNPGDTFRLGAVTFEVLGAPKITMKILKMRCAHCDRVVEYTPEAFCPWCGRALSNGESMFVEQ